MEIQQKLAKSQARDKARARIVRYGAVAAALLLVVGGTLGIVLRNAGLGAKGAADSAASLAPAVYADGEQTTQSTPSGAPEEIASAPATYDDLYDHIEGLLGEERTFLTGTAIAEDGADLNALNDGGAPVPASETTSVPGSSMSKDAAADMAGSAVLTQSDTLGSDGTPHSDTNVQVKGVDEADVLKTDGKYIYYIAGEQLVILEAAGKDTKLVSAVTFGGGAYWYGGAELFILGDRLMIIAEGTQIAWVADGTQPYEQKRNETYTYVYDIRDRTEPKLACTLGQSGHYVSSRMIDGYVYVVTTQYVYGIVRSEPVTYVPYLTAEADSQAMSLSGISLDGGTREPVYTVVTSLDLARGVRHTDARAVLGTAGSLYADGEHLLLAATDYWNETTPIAPDETGKNVQITRSGARTRLVLFSLDMGRIERTAAGTVEGALLNQFAMDAYKGVFRVVTTINDWTERIYTDGVDQYEYEDHSENCLFTLDAQLQPLGALRGLAEDEWVESVRFDGDIAYFVTFRQTDPLFTVDVSDPKRPVLLGALKIPGFSEYLHMFSEGRLLGIGYEADEETGWRESVKLTMFDVGNKRDVKELSTHALTAGYTAVGSNHKAVLVDAERDLIAFPADEQYYVFGYSDAKGFYERASISIVDAWSHAVRGLFIGDCFYVISNSALLVFRLDDFTRLATVRIG